MTPSRTFFLFAITAVLFASARTASTQEQEQPPLSTRVYDVRDLVRNATRYLPVTAGEATYAQTADVVAEDPRPPIDLGDLVQLLQQATGQSYWEENDVELRPEEAGLLSVYAHTATHERLSQALTQLRRTLFEQVLVEILELPAAALAGQPAVLSHEATKALLQRVGAQRRFLGRATIEQPLLLESTQVKNEVRGPSIRVAGDAAVPDPCVDTSGYGASWTVRVTRTTGDAMMVSVSGSDRALELPTSPRENPSGAAEEHAALQLKSVRIATCSAGARLLPGQGLLLGSNTATGKILCVRVRPIGPPIGSEIGELTTFPILALVRPAGCDTLGVDLQVPHEAATLFPKAKEGPLPAVFDEGRLLESISSTIRPDTWDGCPNTMGFLAGRLYVHADAPTCEEIRERLRSLEAIDDRQFSLEVRFGAPDRDVMNVALINGVDELAASLPHCCQSVVSASRGTRVGATRHRAVVKDFRTSSNRDIDVPVIGSVAEGFLLSGDLSVMDARFVRLDLNLMIAQDESGGAVFDIQAPRVGKVDKIDIRENRVRGAYTVELGRWTMMHMSPVQGTDRHMTVVARVTEL